MDLDRFEDEALEYELQATIIKMIYEIPPKIKSENFIVAELKSDIKAVSDIIVGK